MKKGAQHMTSGGSTALAILAAIASSACCTAPLIAVVAGLSGFAPTLHWLEPLRPYLIGTAIVALAFAWYREWRISQSETECGCEGEGTEKRPFLKKRATLIGITLLAGTMIGFPYYSGTLFPEAEKEHTNTTAIENGTDELFLRVEGMTCTGCEKQIEQAALKKEGVHQAKADHREGNTSFLFNPKKVTPEEIVAEIEEGSHYEAHYQEREQNGTTTKNE